HAPVAASNQSPNEGRRPVPAGVAAPSIRGLPRRSSFYSGAGWSTKNAPSRMNISSSVVVPNAIVHASQSPSPAPGVESHSASTPLQDAPICPAVQPVGVVQGPPGKLPTGYGDVDWRFTWSGSV